MALMRFSPYLVGALITLLYHHQILRNWGDSIQGDIGDARFVIFIVEHLVQSVLNKDNLLSPPFFYPETNTLGFSDVHLVFAFFTLPLRKFFQIDPYLSLQVSIIAQNYLAYFFAYRLNRHILRLDYVSAIIGAALFAFNSSKTAQSGHIQLQSLWILPWITSLFVSWWHTPHANPILRPFPLLLGVLLLHIQLLTSFYNGWFYILIFSIFVFVILCRPNTREPFVKTLKLRKSELLGASLTFVIGSYPLLSIYLPTLGLTGGRDFSEAVWMIPRLNSWLWTGPQNFAHQNFSAFFKSIQNHPMAHELIIGVGFMPVLAIATAFALKKKPEIRRLETTLLATILIVIVIASKLGGFTPWRFIFEIVPGAKAIRAVSRIAIPLWLPLSILVALSWHHISWRFPAPKLRPLFCLIGLTILAEQIHVSIPEFSKRTEENRIRALESQLQLNGVCSAFYVTQPTDHGRPNWALQIDAMMLALHSKIPTLNGYSGLSPKDWHLGEPNSKHYHQNTRDWIDQKIPPAVRDKICQVQLAPQ